jgi:hypothetical protein
MKLSVLFDESLVEISLKVSSGLERLAVIDLGEPVQSARRRGPRKCCKRLRNRALCVEAVLHEGIKGRMRAQQPILRCFDGNSWSLTLLLLTRVRIGDAAEIQTRWVRK